MIKIGNVCIYGRDAMHYGVNIKTRRFGYICFRLPLPCFGRWWALYLYFSPNATPWAATFMIGRKSEPRDWSLSRVRKYVFGHNFNVYENYETLCKINDSI